MIKHYPAIAILAFAATACQTGPAAPQIVNAPSAPAFVQAACADCHSVEQPFLSPNENAPSFAAIANQQGLTDATLANWLSNAHNYPEVMDFDLEPDHIQLIAEYMITLRREDYVPAE